MSTIARALGRSVKLISAGADLFVSHPPSVVVLAYHQVGGPQRSSVNLSSAMFDDQMAWLVSQEAFRVITLDQAVEDLAGPKPWTDSVVVTFDDGTADFVENAVPILDKHKVPATLYLATDFVESKRSFWDDGTVLSWEGLAEALGSGLVAVGSHTHTHALLDRVDEATAQRELDRSIGLINDRLGVEARHFAYPKALAPSPRADVLVRARFVSAALAGGRPNPYSLTDPHRLARTPIVAADGMNWFTRKARGGLRLEGGLRERNDRRRYSRASR